ncbi:hypothetical protein [Streptomyces sioyaensis]|uniref:hypothetical protein n=1 Tax=Streptomyces sioyaensis TaxID=67364 RepID=UPI00378D68E5
MLLAGEWYNSDAFWKAATAVIALLALSWGVYTWRFKDPKRQFLYGMSNPTPLLSAPEGVRQDLELRHRGEVLTDPHVLQVTLINRGRKDIPSTDFDGGRSIRCDLGVRIIAHLSSTCVPESLKAPKLAIKATVIEAAPTLIRSRQSITYALLVDGAKPILECDIPIINVHPREIDSEYTQGIATEALTVALVSSVPLGAVIDAVLSIGIPSWRRRRRND